MYWPTLPSGGFGNEHTSDPFKMGKKQEVKVSDIIL